MRLILRRIKHRAAADEGLSMVLVMMIMIATAMFVAAGFAAANGDLPVARNSQDRKAAYAAAESGLNFYQYHLNADNDYWLKCDNVPKPNATELNPVNLKWATGTTDPRRWRNVAGSEAQYTIELLPAKGKAQCVQGDPTSMLDPTTSTFRIRVTGRPNATSKLRRTIIATFRRSGFLDYLYFTHRETLDPEAYPTDKQVEATSKCGQEKLRSQRDQSFCQEITFPGFDALNGPLHTNDESLWVCDNPTLGRTTADRLEVAGSKTPPGWKQNPTRTDCSGSPVIKGVFKVGAKVLSPPPNNATLKAVAQSGGLFLTGKTTITFQSGGGMKITNAVKGWSNTSVAMPANGVIYVDEVLGTCNKSVPPVQADYSEPAGCAKVYVSGQYAADVTLASSDDIIIKSTNGTSDPLLKRNGDYVLGLVADNYVRVYHACDGGSETAMNTVTVDAAILSVAHSFIVDNYDCGDPQGKLNITGAIAQYYRGIVGQFSGNNLAHGYSKNYWYDDRLRYRTPPYFLNPIEVSWAVQRTNEQVPPADRAG